jgi:hypothetical protein
MEPSGNLHVNLQTFWVNNDDQKTDLLKKTQ